MRASGTERRVPASAVFTFIGAAPRTEWLPERIQRDERGFVMTGAALGDERLLAAQWPLPRRPFLARDGHARRVRGGRRAQRRDAPGGLGGG